MKWIGLTGGIATGKSTVAKILDQSGFKVVDADVVARQVVQPGTDCFKRIVKTFGRTLVQSDGQLDRKALGALVFSDPKRRLELENISHPYIQAHVLKLRKQFEQDGVEIAFYDVPLLFEKKLEKDFDAVVLVASSIQNQLNRLMRRNSLSEDQAKERMSAQIPISEKISKADYIIWNDGSEKHLEIEVLNFLEKMKSDFES